MYRFLLLCVAIYGTVHATPESDLRLIYSYMKHVDPYVVASNRVVTPQQFIEKARNNTITQSDIHNYIMFRIVHRVRHRLCELEQHENTASSEYYAYITNACRSCLHGSSQLLLQDCVSDRISDAILTSLLPGGIHVRHMNAAAGVFSPTDRSITVNQKCVYQAPFLCLYVIEHEITHLEQFYNTPPLYNRFRESHELRPIDMQFVEPSYTLLSSNMEPCEYDADFHASQFTPYPYAVWFVLQLPGAKNGGVRDEQYPSKDRISTWLSDRCITNMNSCEREREAQLVRAYGYTPFNLNHIGSGITVLSALGYAALYSINSTYSWVPAAAALGGAGLYNTMWAPSALRPLWHSWVNNIHTAPVSGANRMFDYAISAYSALRDVTSRGVRMAHQAYHATCVPDDHRSIHDMIRMLSIDVAPRDPYCSPRRILCERDLDRIVHNEVYKRQRMHDESYAKRYITAIARDHGVVEIIPREKTRELDDL